MGNDKDTELATRQKQVRDEVITQLVRQRRMKDLTQGDVAAVTGIHRANLSRLESGQYNPTLDMLVRVADSMGLEVKITLEDRT